MKEPSVPAKLNEVLFPEFAIPYPGYSFA